ncbi:MAG: phosphate/phosphite/phosphonate ABC transporter substrate-binding protein [Candidatus Cloacimonetes bacterium]|nr:phosphate/phosphite/phosphonate ABC transporter substrate-binding protein [Candidatus Cloacimonadota bacterium]
MEDILRTQIICFLIMILLLAACGGAKQPLGSEKNPIKLYFVPSAEAAKVIASGNQIAGMLKEITGYHFISKVPTSYAPVIEAMGTEEADVAFLPTFAYVLAHDKYKAEVTLMTIRHGLQKYRGQLVCRADSGIDSLSDIEGKIIAYTDVASTSGHVYPAALLALNGIEPDKKMFAGGHPQAIIAVYNNNADIGCTFWSPPSDKGEPQDARKLVLATYPDVAEKVIPFAFTEWIPNDTITFGAHISPELRAEISEALMQVAASEDGRKILDELYSIDGFAPAQDSDYDVVRQTLEALDMRPENMLR